jgi:hypothetical protein
VFGVLQIVASAFAVALLLPLMVALLFLYSLPGLDYKPSALFHRLRRFVFRVFAGRALRPFTLRASLPSGPSIKASDETTI